ncbi:MAG: M28 family peptidase [Armatimonadota bacterium]|nr:M28 family peptidase [Armatimonadota bacterium]MDR5702534.1 M28 family peptidase [Armatimonadota bacterium]
MGWSTHRLFSDLRMPRVLLGVLLAIVFTAGSGLLIAQETPAISGQAAYAHVVALAGQIGARPAGSVQDRQAAEYIAGQFQSFGYPVERQAFPVLAFETRRVFFQTLSPERLSFSPEVLVYSPPTPPEGVEGLLVHVGLGRPEDFRGKDVRGHIALAQRGAIFFSEKARNAARYGAVGVVIYNNRPGNIQGTLVGGSPIPAVTISQEEGQRLLGLINRGPVRARLLVDTLLEERTTWNVVASKLGRGQPRKVVVIGAHFDSVPAAPGANDNASGVAVVLEVSRVLAPRSYPYTLAFVAFGAEELGLLGSQHYVRTAGQDVVAMINVDVVGQGDRLLALNTAGRGPLLDLADRLARELGIPLGTGRSAESDHVSFEQMGIPAIFLARPEITSIHTPEDVPATVNPRALEETARFVVALVEEIASGRAGF